MKFSQKSQVGKKRRDRSHKPKLGLLSSAGVIREFIQSETLLASLLTPSPPSSSSPSPSPSPSPSSSEKYRQAKAKREAMGYVASKNLRCSSASPPPVIKSGDPCHCQGCMGEWVARKNGRHRCPACGLAEWWVKPDIDAMVAKAIEKSDAVVLALAPYSGMVNCRLVLEIYSPKNKNKDKEIEKDFPGGDLSAKLSKQKLRLRSWPRLAVKNGEYRKAGAGWPSTLGGGLGILKFRVAEIGELIEVMELVKGVVNGD